MEHSFPVNLLVLLGPTASGKTRLAAKLARVLDAEIISADSRQVYRGMNIGTGKDYDDYIVDGIRIPCHLLDLVDPGYEYNLFEYMRDLADILPEVNGRGKQLIMCGGTGLYIEAVIKNYKLVAVPVNKDLREKLAEKTDSELESILKSYRPLHNTTDTVSRKRAIRAIEIEEYYRLSGQDEGITLSLNPKVFGILLERNVRRKRITERLAYRLKNGMTEEAEQIMRLIGPEKMMYYGLEYKYLALYLIGKLDYDQMFEGLNTAIHQFAKRQMTWFRGMEKRGTAIHWIDGSLPPEEMVKLILAQYQTNFQG